VPEFIWLSSLNNDNDEKASDLSKVGRGPSLSTNAIEVARKVVMDPLASDEVFAINSDRRDRAGGRSSRCNFEILTQTFYHKFQTLSTQD